MGVFSRLLRPTTEREQRSLESAWLLEALNGAPSMTGVAVTPENSLTYTTVLACVRVLAESVASLPCILYERFEQDGRDAKRRARDHKLYALLHDLPNPVITAFELYEMGMAHLLLWGNFYAEIDWDRRGQAVGLWPLAAWRVTPTATRQGKVYRLELEDGEEKTLNDYQVLHVPSFGYDGVQGKSMIRLAREAIALGLAAERFGGAFFGNGARPGVVLEHPAQLSDDAHARLRSSWNAQHQGLSNAQRVAILEEGMKLQTIGIPPEDAQFLQTRQFQRNEIASIFRVPPHMIGDLERATFSNIEQQSTDFLTNALRPWLRRWEQRVNRSLLIGDVERRRYFAEFLVDALLRGDLTSRYAAYSTGRQWGWLSVNDIRTLENMNPVDGGEEYLVPMNMTAAGELDASSDEPDEADEADGPEEAEEREAIVLALREARDVRAVSGRRRLETSYVPTLQHVAQRVVNREVNDMTNAAKRFLPEGNTAGMEMWWMTFDRDHSQFVKNYLDAPLRTYIDLASQQIERELGREIDAEPVNEFATNYVDARRNEWMARLRRLMQNAMERPEDWDDEEEFDALDRLLGALGNRQESYAENFAIEQTSRGINALAVALFAIAGVARKVWRSFGESCPYCEALDGLVIEVEGDFIGEGASFGPGGAAPFVPTRSISYPPLHAGCKCEVMAE
jgi:HK97 family phage portal protein